MPLAPGSRLGPYEVEAPIGAGGMGEVYKARDRRLDRVVAIKILPPQLAGDPQFRDRFTREARTISTLSHPNICALYDVGELSDDAATSGVPYLVLEFLQGETLAARLVKGALPLPEALRIGREIANALDAAHRKGIVHRDLKPGNVFLVRTGSGTSSTVKLLDFGLAKVQAANPTPPSGESLLATRTSPTAGQEPITEKGTILGTSQYMAPEQVEGEEADARSDLFSFGAVLYEMITGRRAFDGKSRASLLSAILKDDPPPVSQVQPLAVPALDHVVRTCLSKDPDARFQTAHDVALQLKWIAEGGSAAGLAPPPMARRRSIPRLAWIAAAVVAGGLISAITWWVKPAPVRQQITARFEYPLPSGQNFTRPGRHTIAISPDGSKVVYVANTQLHVRALNRFDTTPVPGTAEDPMEPLFSPDGNWIAYFAPSAGGTTLKKVAVSGGAPVPLAEIASLPYGASWHGSSIFVGVNNDRTAGIQSIPDSGGTPQSVVTVATTERAWNPRLLPDGQHLLFTILPIATGPTTQGKIVLQALGQSERKVLIDGAVDAVLVDDRMVFSRDATLLAQRFDTRTLALVGAPVPAVEGVASTANLGQFAVSASGVLAYRPGTVNAVSRMLVWVDRQGKQRPFGTRAGGYLDPRISPDGSRLAVSSEQDIWIWSFEKETLTRLTFTDAGNEYNPAWLPDGRHVIFDSTDGGAIHIVRRSADGTGSSEVVRRAPAGYPETIAPDGKSLVYHTVNNVSMLAPLEPTGEAKPLVPTTGQLLNAEISPDGRWVAYQSNESGQFEIYVRPFPSVDTGKWQVSSKGGSFPLWSRNGRELFFIAGTTMTVVPVQLSPVFSFGKLESLFSTGPFLTNVARDYDVTADGRQFVMVVNVGATASTAPSFVVVTNWADELKAQMGSPK